MYIVVVTRCDEVTELGDLAESQFYGPYRLREAAEEKAKSVYGTDLEDGTLYSSVIRLEKFSKRKILADATVS